MHENCDPMKAIPGEERKRQWLLRIKIAAAVRRKLEFLFNR